jgi:chromosome segregation and condensation protein ScpB
MTGTTYGIKLHPRTVHGKPYLFTTTRHFISARFVGLGSNHAAKEWKTRRGAERAAQRYGGEVFEIVGDVMRY